MLELLDPNDAMGRMDGVRRPGEALGRAGEANRELTVGVRGG